LNGNVETLRFNPNKQIAEEIDINQLFIINTIKYTAVSLQRAQSQPESEHLSSLESPLKDWLYLAFMEDDGRIINKRYLVRISNELNNRFKFDADAYERGEKVELAFIPNIDITEVSEKVMKNRRGNFFKLGNIILPQDNNI
jgi:hypothetical protein